MCTVIAGYVENATDPARAFLGISLKLSSATGLSAMGLLGGQGRCHEKPRENRQATTVTLDIKMKIVVFVLSQDGSQLMEETYDVERFMETASGSLVLVSSKGGETGIAREQWKRYVVCYEAPKKVEIPEPVQGADEYETYEIYREALCPKRKKRPGK